MSFNESIFREDELKLILIKDELLKNRKDLNFLKSTVLDLDEYERNLEEKDQEFEVFNQLNIEAFENLKNNLDFKHLKINSLNKFLLDKFNSYSSEIDNKKLLVEGKLKELRSKLSLLRSKDEKTKFLVKEEFFNLFNLNTTRNIFSNLSADTEANVLTLPVSYTSKAEVGRIFISSNSNCIPGNYLNGKNKYIYSIIDESEETVFEAFKEGEGPLVLDISLTFKKEEIINEICLSQLATRGSSNMSIDDIIYSDANSRSLSIKQLVDLNHQNLDLINSTDKQKLKIKHLPAKAVQAKIVLKVKEYSFIENNKVFFLGLKQIEFVRNTYNLTGEIISNTFNVPGNLFEISYKDYCYPKKKLTFDAEMFVSIDNGGSFTDISKTNLITNGNEKQIVYKYAMKKNLAAINRINEIFDDNYFLDIEAKTSVIDKNTSPFNYELPFEKILRDSFKVVQSKVLSRGDALSRRTKLGTIRNAGVTEFPLEINLNQFDIEEIKVFANRKECNLQVNEADLESASLNWYLSNNGKTIKVYVEGNQPLLEVSVLIKPLLPKIEKKREGYYIRINEQFDYDKNAINIKLASNLSDTKEKTLPPGREKVFLPDSHIDRNSVSIEHYNGTQWESIDVNAIYGESLNVLDGIIKIPATYLDLKKRISYKHYNVRDLQQNDFEIWIKDEKVNGLFLYPENISFETREDILGGDYTQNYYLFDGTYSDRGVTINDDNSFLLSSKNIIQGSLSVSDSLFDGAAREINYIDGFSEFLNLQKMQKDYCPNIEKDAEGFVTFSLQELPYLNLEFSKDLQVFDSEGNEFSTEIQFNNQNQRIVSIKLKDTDTTSKNYFVSYYYQSDEKNDLTYSVDYENGILFTSEPVNYQMEPEIKISYSIGRVGVEYYLYNEIKNFEVDFENQQVKVFNEEFFEVNRNIKFLAFKNKDIYNFEGLENYFSPIIYSLEIGLK